jgi:hypothetical protein
MSTGEKVQDMAEALLLCLQAQYVGDPQAPAEFCWVPGEAGRLWLTAGTAEDRCCSGFAWVRVVNLAPQIPGEGELASPCGVTEWRLDLEAGVARCAPWGDETAGPTCAELAVAADRQARDAEAILKAICCLRPQVESERSQPTNGVPFGPDGRCIGWVAGVSVIIINCDCED